MFYPTLHLMQTFFYISNLSRAHNIREPIELNNFSCIRLALRNWILATEEPAANDFVARKVRTIELNKVQGTNWIAIKCKEPLGSCSEAVVRQATINLDSWLWKSLGDSLPKLYCVDLAKAYVTQESVSLRILCEKKRYDSRLPNRSLHEKPSAKGGTGKENWY